VNILIVKLSAIGDVIHTLPSLSALRRFYPDADITWVVEEAAADLLAGHPDLSRLIVSRRKRWIGQLRRGRIAEPFRDMVSFLRELRSRPYDLVIDFHGLFKSAALVLFSGGRRKLGYDSLQELSGLFYNEKIPEDLGKHAVDRYLDFVRHVAGKTWEDDRTSAPEFRIAFGENERRRVAELLRDLPRLEAGKSAEPDGRPLASGTRPGAKAAGEGGGGGLPPFIAVNPVALWETKLWQEEKFAALCDRIRGEWGIPVVLTGDRSAPLDRILKMMKTTAVNLGGRTTLRELAALYHEASLLVSTDSGPMHLAAAVGTPVVALFGPTDPARTGPYGSGHRVIRTGLACSPCFRKSCSNPRCMTEISVEEVLTAAKEMLAAKN